LRKSVVRKEVDSVRWLLQKGANPTVRGGEPIHLAIDEYKKIEKISPEQAKKVLDIIGLLYNSLETSEIGRKIIQGVSKSPDRLEILNKSRKKY
jgi:predicted methyltransferase